MTPVLWMLLGFLICGAVAATIFVLLVYADRPRRRRSKASSSQPRASAGAPPLPAQPVSHNGAHGSRHERSYGGTR